MKTYPDDVNKELQKFIGQKMEMELWIPILIQLLLEETICQHRFLLENSTLNEIFHSE